MIKNLEYENKMMYNMLHSTAKSYLSQPTYQPPQPIYQPSQPTYQTSQPAYQSPQYLSQPTYQTNPLHPEYPAPVIL